MCRLYGMRASHPTKSECELLDAQNSLIEQSREDARGLENPHGWGIGMVKEGRAHCARQVEPADESEEYRAQVLQTNAETVVAHVRRATVGEPKHENTHPFRWEDTFLAHNGHIGCFGDVQPRILEALSPRRREAIGGTTDSEHFFQLAVSKLLEGGANSQREALERAVSDLRGWVDDVGPDTELALNTLWVWDGELAGTKIDRELWCLEREQPVDCDICGHKHAHPEDGRPYRAAVLASERITDEDWQRVPEGSVFWIDSDYSFRFAAHD